MLTWDWNKLILPLQIRCQLGQSGPKLQAVIFRRAVCLFCNPTLGGTRWTKLSNKPSSALINWIQYCIVHCIFLWFICSMNTRTLMKHLSSIVSNPSWLDDWPTDWLHGMTDWQIDGVIDWLTYWKTDVWNDGLTDSLTDLLTDWQNERVTDWLSDWLIDENTDCLTENLMQGVTDTDWLKDWLMWWWTDRLMVSSTDWQTEWRTDWMGVSGIYYLSLSDWWTH